ncbi:hypothetical protein QBC38DRAFT_365236 [Podospora fimiseda]|uniref:C2H2-type domain-containing protein n=1 Tax=Podospora fimiseda TaxID=252190 RepID=A0AAN7BP58_9PEZI|nr:hypothetical protein QBC38DRAFT_365236 [Podospora fimiseda]
MLQNQNRPYTTHNNHYQQHSNNNNNNNNTSSFRPELNDIDFYHHINTINHNNKSLSSSPISSTQSLSQFSSLGSSPLSTFDSIPTPRGPGGYEGSLFEYSPQSHPATLAESSIPLFPTTADLMQTDTWTGQLTPRSVGRISHHQRESSLSSLGSNGPASPFSHNTTNPQIAVTDSLGDGFQGFTANDDYNYQLAVATKPFPGVSHDTFYTNGLPAFGSTGSTTITGYPQVAAAPKQRKNDRGLLQPSENPIGSNRSQPVSVASSVNSDSPATPAGDLEEDRRNKNAMHTVPKLDRTMTDVYGDELYNPNFTITSSTSSVQMSITSPTHDMFVQRMQAANNQHLTANSPVSATSRDRSPFRQGSPLAPTGIQDFGASQIRFGSVQQMREQDKAMRDVQAQQQFGRSVHTTTPPATISPKDALLDFHETDGDTNFPLFPQQQNNNNNMMNAVSKPPTTQSQQVFDGLPMDTTMFNNYFGQLPQLPVQVPQAYPFIAQPRQQSSVPSLSNGSLSTTRVSSVDVAGTDSLKSPQRPADTSTDGGTYTCTYHGCTLRFETPALLQKHKRDGHRAAHGLNGSRRPDALGSLPANMMSQAGPHRCDRINPSTGKPCNTIFSRPYDLTRHEDTIHNARKQKVRCNLCTDEKTFSRADALTRHYRVCHPEVEFPGKRRRGHAG